MFNQETFLPGASRDVEMKALETSVFVHRDSAGEPGRALVYRDLERQMRAGSGNRESVSAGALRGESGGRVPILRTLKDM